MDQLSFSEKPGWVEQATITLEGEVRRPGVYAIDRGETLCQVLQRAGGLTVDAYAFGAVFTRESVRRMQQETIDELHEQLDDLMVDLSLSHSFNNEEKSSPEWAGKQDYLKAIRQLERAEANGRLVVDLDRVRDCESKGALVLEDGDRLEVPNQPDFVQVSGQVYVATSHLYDEERTIEDYIELSGGSTVLGKLKHAYVIQANGEVLNFKGSRTSSRIGRKTVQPGARIYVPLNVDRMNGTEKAQSWVSTLVNSAILAGIVL
jgi:protein involved in polysaccharide export with SLBB domain